MKIDQSSHTSLVSAGSFDEPSWAEIQTQRRELEEWHERLKLPEWHSDHPFYGDYCKELRQKQKEARERGWKACTEAFERIRQVNDPIEREYCIEKEWDVLKKRYRPSRVKFRALYRRWAKAQEVAS